MNNTPLFEARLLEDDILAIVLRANLDSASTPEFDQLVREHLNAGHTRIIIDCCYMGFISSLGIGSLVALQTRLRRQGGAVKLAAIQGPVMQVLKAVRLDKVFDHYGDLEFARKSFYE
jgi:anti-anti-sigma factor